MFCLFVYLFFKFSETVFLCIFFYCLGTYSVDSASLELTGIRLPLLPLWSVGIKGVTMPYRFSRNSDPKI